MKKATFLFLSVLTVLFSCVSEPVDLPNINQNNFAQDSELFLIIEENLAGAASLDQLICVHLDYSFIVFIFDEAGDYLEPVNISNDSQLTDLLNGLNTGYSISIDYPISASLETGETVVVETNEQLLEAFNRCFEQQRINECNNIFTECPWIVTPLEGFPNDYEGEEILADFIVMSFHSENMIHRGTWLGKIIDNDLHINFNFNTTGPIADFWNEDWKITTLTKFDLEAVANGKRIRLDKSCLRDCTYFVLETCANAGATDIATFDLLDYNLCAPIPNHDVNSNSLQIRYFPTEEDAKNDMNEITSTSYTNTVNPEIIYTRLEEIESEELLRIDTLELQVKQCE